MRRNPRRAYTKEGVEIEPMSVASMLAHGVRTVEAECRSCKHTGEVDVSTFPQRMAIPDVALKLRCSSCGSRMIDTRPSWSGFDPTRLGRQRRGEG